MAIANVHIDRRSSSVRNHGWLHKQPVRWRYQWRHIFGGYDDDDRGVEQGTVATSDQ